MATSVKKKKKKKEDMTPSAESALGELIIIDKSKGLIFKSEEEVFDHFAAEIAVLEEEYEAIRKDTELSDEEIGDFEEILASLFELPDEVWKNEAKIEGLALYTYIKHFDAKPEGFYYLAVCYVEDQIPTFIFLHFATRDKELIKEYQKGTRLFVKDQVAGAGDALSEGDDLAVGLYRAMLTLRSETDIPEADFAGYSDFRDPTVEDADEVWKSQDLQGNTLVTFMKNYETETGDFTYVTITLEDPASESHYVLFSFPTRDSGLLDRYRHGETMHTENIVQEESH